MQEGLRIKKGGIVELTRWDSKRKKPGYSTTDVTDRAHKLLFEPVTLDDDVALRDIFLILQRELDFYNTLFGNWCKEIVNEAFSPAENNQKPLTEDGMQYLEVFWLITEGKHKEKMSLSGHHFPAFHGWGIWDDGTEGGFGVEFTPVYQLLDYPVKLNNDMIIYDEVPGKTSESTRTYNDITYTLGHVLYAIIWELSFFGSPTMRDAQSVEIFGAISEMKNKNEQ